MLNGEYVDDQTFISVRNSAIRKQISLCLRLQALSRGIETQLQEEMDRLAGLLSLADEE